MTTTFEPQTEQHWSPPQRASWWAGVWTIASIELRQRVRGVAAYVLLGVFAFILLLVTIGAALAVGAWADGSEGAGGAVYAIVMVVTLLLATLVSPALSGNAINGDREEGTLATTQVTLITATQLVLGKVLAAWITTLAFAVVAVPFILYTVILGGLSPSTLVVSFLIIVIEMGVIAAAGVGLSGILRKPLMSVVVTYLIVAALSIGTLIAFAIVGASVRSHYTYVSESADWARVDRDERAGLDPYQADRVPKPEYCTEVYSYESDVPRFDTVWWVLAANPYVILSDAVPTTYDRYGSPNDVFGFIKLGIRQAQITPQLEEHYSDCDPNRYESSEPRNIIETTVPSWFVGLALHIAGAGLLVWGAITRVRAPARRLGAGQRIA